MNLKPDGSGTVVLSLRVSKETLNQMKGLGGDAEGDPLKDAFKPGEVQKIEKEMGVKFEKVEDLDDAKWAGKRATFSFTDVTKLKLDVDLKNMVPGADIPSAAGAGDALSLQFTKGAPSVLTIKMPQAGAAAAGNDAPGSDEELAMMQAFLKDMRVTMALNIEGTIKSTNATVREGSRIVLLDLPVGEIAKDKEKFKALNKAGDFKATAELLKGVPGTKIETQSEVKVEFE